MTPITRETTGEEIDNGAGWVYENTDNPSRQPYPVTTMRTPSFFAEKLGSLLDRKILEELVQCWELEEKTKDLASFMQVESHGLWKPEPHLLFLCKKLEKVAAGGIRRLIVTVPPRHGKSLVCSTKFPAWYLRQYPNNKVIITSYSADLSQGFSRDARNTIIQTPELFPNISLSPESRSIKNWKILGGTGGLMATGVGGAITGFGGNLLVIDDPYKNFEEANSLVIRDKVWEWYRSTLRTRLAPGGSIILILTRWHMDDLAGRLLREEKENQGEYWEVVNFPAIAEEDDILGRKKGDALSPRFPIEELLLLKKSLGNYIFSALYQQRPRAKEGNYFLNDWFEPCPDVDMLLARWKSNMLVPEIYAAMDLAIGEKEQNDFNCILIGMKNPEESGSFILLDRISFKGMSDADIIADNILRVQKKYRPLVFGFEEGVIRKSIWSTVEHRIQEAGSEYAINPHFFVPVRDKVARARTLQGQMRMGCWNFQKGLGWFEEFSDCLLSFPYGGKHDDDVDAFAYLAMLMLEQQSNFSDLDLS